MSRPPVLRVMTYNVHRCLGWDGVTSPARIAKVIAAHRPDVVALQELDVGRARSGHVDQPRAIAALLKMEAFFFPALERENEHYGDAVLSRLPMRLARAGPLPTLPGRPWLEPRGALWVRLRWAGREVQLVNTHLGLNGRERLAQVEALLGPDWLGHPDCAEPRILCGDFNARPGCLSYRRLRRALRDAQDWPGVHPRGTFPSLWPVLRIDHVFHSPDLAVTAVRLPRDRAARVASDHLPLTVEVSLP
jgi:endonuclease/exonuclease/phosphatase family metal-dependent hydrolase